MREEISKVLLRLGERPTAAEDGVVSASGLC